jgi:two-component system, OmpR family, KDP operon response regulator KdpE
MSAADSKPEILVVDDEVQIRKLLRLTLESSGYAVREAETGQAGLVELATRRPDAVILDLGLPDMPGGMVLQRLREWSRVPVLILSVLGQDEQKIAALDSGADDYLTKPFSGGELLARLRVMLRREQPTDDLKVVRFGSVEVDLVGRVVTRDGAEVRLTAKEYAMLRLLVLNSGKVIVHRQMLRELWGPNAGEQTQYLRVYMGRLRQKLERDPNHPRHLMTELGIGYRLVTD